MSVPQRLPFVNGDDGQWGDILVQWLKKEHYDDGTDNAVNGGHQKVTLRAGTATAGTAPLKFTSGTLLSAAEAGALEFLTDKIYFTVTTGPTRKTVAIYDDSSGATGDIYYRDSSGNFVRLGIGSSGDILKVSGGLPAWVTTNIGDASTNTSSSVDSEVALFSGTGGKTLKRATGSGIAKLTSGVLSTATSGTDYAPATSGTSILKGDGAGGTTAAVANTDYPAINGPNFTGNVTYSLWGKITLATGVVSSQVQQVNLFGNVGDTQPGANLQNISNGTPSLNLGPGGTTAADVKITRTGTSAATITGVWTFSSAPVISSISNTGTLTLPTSTDTLVGRATTDTLTNKTLTSPVISSISNTGTLTLPTSTDTLVGRATTDTLTNKRITRRTASTSAPGGTPSINSDNLDYAEFTGLNAAITSMTTNLTGTPNRGDTLWISFTDNGTGRAITWGTKFESSTVILPTTTVASARLDVGFIWNTATSKWRCVAVA